MVRLFLLAKVISQSVRVKGVLHDIFRVGVELLFKNTFTNALSSHKYSYQNEFLVFKKMDIFIKILPSIFEIQQYCISSIMSDPVIIYGVTEEKTQRNPRVLFLILICSCTR